MPISFSQSYHEVGRSLATSWLACHAERRHGHIASLQREATESEPRLKRLYDVIQVGVADLDDLALKERIADLMPALSMQDGPAGEVAADDSLKNQSR